MVLQGIKTRLTSLYGFGPALNYSILRPVLVR